MGWFLATLTSATILLAFIARFKRYFRLSYSLLPKRTKQQLLLAIADSSPAVETKRRSLWQIDYILQRNGIVQNNSFVPPGFRSRLNSQEITFGHLGSELKSELSQRLDAKNTAYIWKVFGLTYRDLEGNVCCKYFSLLAQDKLYLLLLALLHLTPCQVDLEIIKDVTHLILCYLNQESGKPVLAFGASEARRLVSLYTLYLPPGEARQNFTLGVSFVLPKPGETLTWDEAEFIQ